MHYYQFNIGDYQSHTGHLDPIEDIAYRRMLDWCYLHESALPNLPEEIGRQIRMRGHEDVIKAVLNEFFTFAEEGWYQTRIHEEIQHYHSKVQQASRAGKASAERRINARSTPVQQTNDVRSTDVQPNKKQEPVTKKQEPSLSVAPSALDERFERFWKAYPKKTGKDAAMVSFKKRKPDDKLLNEMVFALGQQKKSPEWLKDNGQFIPNPATWLNQGRWKDEGLDLDKPANPFAGDI